MTTNDVMPPYAEILVDGVRDALSDLLDRPTIIVTDEARATILGEALEMPGRDERDEIERLKAAIHAERTASGDTRYVILETVADDDGEPVDIEIGYVRSGEMAEAIADVHRALPEEFRELYDWREEAAR